MNSKIITSEKKARRVPALAFFLSLFITGLGQAYNGDPLRGMVLLFLRTAPLFAAPLYMFLKKNEYCLRTAAVLFIASAAAACIAPIDALLTAKRIKTIVPKKTNTLSAYCAFAAAGLVLMAASYIHCSAFFTVSRADGSGVLFSRGDCLLAATYAGRELKTGDLVLLGNNETGRVMAPAGAAVYLADKRFFINGDTPDLGIMNDTETAVYGTESAETLYRETRGGFIYPVRVALPRKKTGTRQYIPVPDGNILVVKDNRIADVFYRVVPVKDIKGRIEGALFSTRLSRVLSYPFIKNNR